MLTNLKQILKIAESKSIAIGCFNTPGLESLIAVLEAAVENDSPVIISHAELHEEYIPLSIIGPIMIRMADQYNIPVCVHLDHATNMEYIEQGLRLGFTSVMFDGSSLSYSENVNNTRIAVDMAAKYGANVEAELGVVIGHEAGMHGRKVPTAASYTHPEVARMFVKDTGIDALAASFGAQHGLYTSAPKLDFELIARIRQLTNIPLVMHGGSGICAPDLIKAIDTGVSKINYYSYMAKAGLDRVKDLLGNHNPKYFHELAYEATFAMKKDVDTAIKIFSKRLNQ